MTRDSPADALVPTLEPAQPILHPPSDALAPKITAAIEPTDLRRPVTPTRRL
jgi:hypothetical protein